MLGITEEVWRGMTEEQKEAVAAAMSAAVTRKLTVRINRDSGSLSVYGLGQFPVSLYRGQWESLLSFAPAIADFINENKDLLSEKSDDAVTKEQKLQTRTRLAVAGDSRISIPKVK